MKLDYINLGSELFMHRTKNELTRKEVAAQIGISMNSVREFEEGYSENPKVNIVLNICEFIGKSVYDFVIK